MHKKLLMFIILFISLSYSWYYSDSFKRIVFNVSYPFTINDVQILLNIPYQTGMDSQYRDIKVTVYNNSAEIAIPFWIENKTTTSADVWVRLPQLNSSVIVYVYFNSTNLTDLSNGSSTFFFFEDFEGFSLDSSKWGTDVGFSYTFPSSTEITISNALGAYALFYDNLENNYTIESKVKFNPSFGYSGCFACPMSSIYTGGGNYLGSSTVLYMSSFSSNYVSHWVGNGCSNSYNIDTGYLINNVDSLYHIYTIEFMKDSNSIVNFYFERHYRHTDNLFTLCKNFKYIRIGYFYRQGAFLTTPTTYDWVLVRKSYDMSLLNVQPPFVEEHTSFVSVSILNPENGDFLPHSFSLDVNVTLYSPSDFVVLVDGQPLFNTTLDSNGSYSFPISLTEGSHTIEVVANTTFISRDAVDVVVFPRQPSSTTVSYRKIADYVWNYKNRTLTFYETTNISELLSLSKQLLNRTYVIEDLVSYYYERQKQMEDSFKNLSEKVDKLDRGLMSSISSLKTLNESFSNLSEKIDSFSFNATDKLDYLNEEVERLNKRYEELSSRYEDTNFMLKLTLFLLSLILVTNAFMFFKLLSKKRW